MVLLGILLVGIVTRFGHPAGAGPGPIVAVVQALAILVVLGLVIVASAALIRRVGRWLSADATVERLIEAAGRVQEGDYSARVAESGSAESRLLARSFNQMSARLEATDTQRRSFMADVSHELRTPLTVIQGQLEAIRDGVYPPDTEHLAPALDQVAVLERLVEDLRTLSLSESGSLRLARASVDLGALVTETVDAFRATADAAGVDLSVTVTPDLPRVWIDPTRIGSVVRNLVANALRYTPRAGTVSVTVERAGPAHVMVRVHDTGRGLDPAILPTVFERFSRSPDSTGSGLGLAIARALVEAHGGTIAAASGPGSGATMTIRLPI
jgi:two-component system sensor histidine kinase BaeS